MTIEKYTVFVRDTTNKKSFKLLIEDNYPQDAHKTAYNKINNYQEIEKIIDNEGSIVYDVKTGFKN